MTGGAEGTDGEGKGEKKGFFFLCNWLGFSIFKGKN